MEHGFIAWAKQRAMRLPKIKLGIGDDCALIASDGSDWVVTTDSLCEGTHFILDQCGPQAVGRKLVGVNLSDLASMAAVPVARQPIFWDRKSTKVFARRVRNTTLP